MRKVRRLRHGAYGVDTPALQAAAKPGQKAEKPLKMRVETASREPCYGRPRICFGLPAYPPKCHNQKL